MTPEPRDNEALMREALKPCPFCGASAKVWSRGGGSWAVECCECPATGPIESEDQAIAAWNRRPPVEVEEEMVERHAAHTYASRMDVIPVKWQHVSKFVQGTYRSASRRALAAALSEGRKA